MKHILLPSDFSILSLQPIHDVMQQYSEDVVRITLLHLVDMPTGIGDLLFRSQRIADRFPIPNEFRMACELMANRYGRNITMIRPLIRYGSTSSFLGNLIKGMNVDAIFVRRNLKESGPYRESVAIMPLLRKIDCNIIETPPAAKRHSEQAKSTIGECGARP